MLSSISADCWSQATDQERAAAKFHKIQKGLNSLSRGTWNHSSITHYHTITPILLLIIRTARVAQSTSLLPSHWCLASQRPAQLVLREVPSTTICITSLRYSTAIQLCRELKTQPERMRIKQFSCAGKCTTHFYILQSPFSLAASKVTMDGAQLSPIHALDLGSGCQYRSKQSEIPE